MGRNLTAFGATVYLTVATAGGVCTYLFGAWNKSIQILLILMVLDYATGMLLGAIHKSPKTANGALSSKAGLEGIIKKAGMLVVVMIANLFGTLFMGEGDATLREAAIIALVVNEGLSIIENLKAMGVPIPNVVINFINALKKKKDEPINPENEPLSGEAEHDENSKEEVEMLDLGKGKTGVK